MKSSDSFKLSFLNYNVCGLLSKLHSPDFVQLIQSHDVVTLTETFLTTNIDSPCLKDFCVFSSFAKKLSKQGRYSGGVSVLVKRSLEKYVERVNVDVDNSVVIKISKNLLGTSKDVMYISMYLPPCDSKYWNTCQSGYGLELLDKCVVDICATYNDFYILVSGDLNARTAEKNYTSSDPEDSDWLTRKDVNVDLCNRISCDKESNLFGEQLLECCNIFDCIILNGLVESSFDDSYTYVGEAGSSVIDYFIVSIELLSELHFNTLSVKNLVDSDHLPVHMSILLGPKHGIKRENSKYTFKSFQKVVWEREKETQFKEAMQSDNITARIQEAYNQINENTDNAISLFVKCLNEASQCMVKTCNQREVNSAPWYDLECRKEKKECKKLLRLFRKVRSEQNRKEYVKKRNSYKKMLKMKKSQHKAKIAQSLSENMSDSSLFWKDLKKLGGLSKSRIENDITPGMWYEHFKNIFNQDDKLVDEDVESEFVRAEGENIALNRSIDREEIINAIKILKCNKSSGPDGVLAEMIKSGPPVIIEFLVKLFNHIFESGIYPHEWSKAIVVPIHKKGSIDNPENYRGISLISIICKCYTSILNKRLNTWLEENEKIVENQAGFRRAYSTTDHIFTLNAVVQKCLNIKGRKLYAAFVDLKRAFDSVNHTLLMESINREDIKGNFFRSLKAMYASLISCVRSGNKYSEYFDCPVGVRQGCVLSPTLFSLFVNQLANQVNENGVHGVQLLPTLVELFILLFADDIVLISTTPGGLQVQLNTLKECCDSMKLTINLDKTKIIVFRKGGYLGKREKWFLGGHQLEVVNSYCYLGFTFTTMLSYKIGTSHLVTKAKKAVYLINRAFNNCTNMTQQVFFKMFDSKVQSILLYSSELWGLNRLDSVEKVHLLACKRFLGVPLITPNKMVYLELQRYPLYINSYVRSIKYWLRLIHMDISRLPKQSYLMMLSIDRDGKNCWVSQVRDILCNTGFAYAWFNQGVGNEAIFVREFKQRLIDMFKQEMFSAIRDKPRYVVYKLIDRDLQPVEYISNIRIFCFRAVLTQTRMGVLSINANIYRYGNNPMDKMCPFCENMIEDDAHIFFKCPLYVDIRKRYLATYKNCEVYKLLNGHVRDIYFNISRFIFFAMKRRRNMLHYS